MKFQIKISGIENQDNDMLEGGFLRLGTIRKARGGFGTPNGGSAGS